MGPRGRRVAVIATMVALSMLVAGGVVAATRSSDESALAPARHAADRGIERKVDRLLSKMTVGEKLQQLQLLSDGQITDADAKAGVGWVFSLVDPAKIDHFQHIAVEQSRLHIPILFAYDTIHGYRTIFPVPLGAASSFDPSVATADDTVAARETATVGIKQIYSPMVDVSHEPRWGRISEAAGEDPYLGSVFAAARVKAAQGTDYSAPDKVVTSVKHFAAYGQPEGGREYNTTDMSEQRLRNLYLPPFKAAIDAGSDTAMCSFNAISGVPGCADPETETDILKKEWGFDGFIESDYTAVAELRACPPVNPNTGPCGHGVAADGPDAAQAALNAGTDSEMVSTNIRDFGKQLLAQHRISMARVDDAVRRILRVKFRAGLFEHPYVDQTKAVDPASFVTPTTAPRRGRRPASRWSCSRTTASRPARRRRSRSTRPSRRSSSARWATTSTTCSARGGARARTRTRCRSSTASRPRTRTPRSCRAARSRTRTRRTTRPRASAAPTPGSRPPWTRRRAPTRSSWPSARAAARAARRPRAATSTSRACSRSSSTRSRP